MDPAPRGEAAARPSTRALGRLLAALATWFLAALAGCGDRDVMATDAGGATTAAAPLSDVAASQAGPAPEAAAPLSDVAASQAGPAPEAAAAPGVGGTASGPGDPHRGRELAVRFECSRCHDGAGIEPARFLEHCVHCHKDILAGRFRAPPQKVQAWQKSLSTLREVPSLVALGKRYRREWIERFLQEPYDLRPHLLATMPRLALKPDEARDLAAYLAPDAPEPELSLEQASAARGRALLDAKGCGSCHALSGAPALEGGGARPTSAGSGAGGVETRGAVALAPDLRFTRDRFRAAELVRWLRDPRAVKPDTLMPLVPLTADEAGDMAAYLLTAPIEPPAARVVPERLPPLTRRVAWDEVYQRVFRSTCRHCHAEPDDALGDGGPGNTGGFGFPPRRLNLADYAGVAAGFLDAGGQRRSVFALRPDGTPWLVAVLLARQAEEAGRPDPEVRGMPLALPALSPEDIQLVETWIAQGRPQ